MKNIFEVKPTIGVSPVTLGSSRKSVIDAMGREPVTFMKTPYSNHPTDAFYGNGFQVFYSGTEPVVDSIELSRGCSFIAVIGDVDILNLPVDKALNVIEAKTGMLPVSVDGGYGYEIECLGLWLWRPSNETESEEGMYFSTIGVGIPNT